MKARRLRKIFAPNRETVAGGWSTFYGEERQHLYSSPNITKAVTQGGENGRLVVSIADEKIACKAVVGEPEI
jgi:hypothetical protein